MEKSSAAKDPTDPPSQPKGEAVVTSKPVGDKNVESKDGEFIHCRGGVWAGLGCMSSACKEGPV